MDKYKEALEEVLKNLRCIDSPVIDVSCIDEYIDDSIKIIMEVLKEDKKESCLSSQI